MGEVISFPERLNKLKATLASNENGLPPELANPLDEFYRLIGGAMKVAEAEKRADPLVNALCAHLILALVEIDWMRTKRSYMPSDLRAQFEAIVAAQLVEQE